ncbi:hypothetical protein [Reyranella sp.]|uniref:hypothetical protein n=1 Tax=Reyranella sp. TaxID=1929291 RepID=UPI003BAA235E
MRRAVPLVLAGALLAGSLPAFGQAKAPVPGKAAAPAAAAAAPSSLACGSLKAESSRSGATTRWTITGPTDRTTETGTLRSGPRFDCLEGAVLTVEVTSTAGHSLFTGYFPDGTSITYGRQQIDRRGGRTVLPVQARARIPEAYRAAFDYHCRLDMPADPIPAAARAVCLF